MLVVDLKSTNIGLGKQNLFIYFADFGIGGIELRYNRDSQN